MQQINLYLPEFRPKRDWLSLENSLAMLLVYLILMAFYHLSVTGAHHRLEQNVATLEEKVKTLAAQSAALKKKPSAAERALLENQVNNLRKSLKNRQALAKVIGGQSLGNREGFSRHLQALSSNMVKGVALQGFEFEQGGVTAALRGVAAKPEFVPLYVSQLQKAPVFTNTRFGTLTITEEKGVNRFYLSGNQDNPLFALEKVSQDKKSR